MFYSFKNLRAFTGCITEIRLFFHLFFLVMIVISILLEDIIISTMLAMLIVPANILLQSNTFLKSIDLNVMLQVHFILNPLLQEIMTSFFHLDPFLISNKWLETFYFRPLLMDSYVFTIFSFTVRARLHFSFWFLWLLLPEWPICLYFPTPLLPLIIGLGKLILEFQKITMIELMVDWLVKKFTILIVSF